MPYLAEDAALSAHLFNLSGRRRGSLMDESAETGRPVKLGEFEKRRRPELAQEIRCPAVEEPELVGVDTPSGE